MAEIAIDWRGRLRAYLAERIGESVTVGEVMELFTDLVPLHHATRIWCARHKQRDLSSPMRMRRAAITLELVHYPLLWRPERKYKPIKDAHVIVPLGQMCPQCGGTFFAQRGTKSCGPSCGSKAWRQRAVGGIECQA